MDEVSKRYNNLDKMDLFSTFILPSYEIGFVSHCFSMFWGVVGIIKSEISGRKVHSQIFEGMGTPSIGICLLQGS